MKSKEITKNLSKWKLKIQNALWDRQFGTSASFKIVIIIFELKKSAEIGLKSIHSENWYSLKWSIIRQMDHIHLEWVQVQNYLLKRHWKAGIKEQYVHF